MTLDIQEKRFDTGQVILNYAEISSSEPPLVLLHGGSARWQGFDSTLADLAPNFHIYAPDFRGHGKSKWMPNTYCLQDYANDIIAFLQLCLTEPAFLFGHSLGGMIALMVAAQCPTGVRAVAVGDAPLSSKTWHKILYESRERLATWRELAGGQKPLHDLIKILKDSPVGVPDISEAVSMREVFGEESPVFEWLATNLSQNDPDMLSALIDRFQTTAAGYEEETVLPAIGCPVLLMQADPSVGGLMTDGEIAKALPLLAHPRHVKLDGVSHILHNERKDPILEALALFFQS